MKIKIKRLNPNSKIPTKAKKGDFCYDVYATSCKRVGWRTWEYGIGLAVEAVRPEAKFGNSASAIIDRLLASNIVKIAIDFRPRSSIYKTGLSLCNCEGTIDEFYRGEVKAYFYRVNIFKKKYKVGERIGQIKLGFTIPMDFEWADELSKTERGTGGFGSSGK